MSLHPPSFSTYLPTPTLYFLPRRASIGFRSHPKAVRINYLTTIPTTATMGVFSRVEDRPTPPAVYNWRVYLCAAIAAAAAVMIGYGKHFSSKPAVQPSISLILIKLAHRWCVHWNHDRASIVRHRVRFRQTQLQRYQSDLCQHRILLPSWCFLRLLSGISRGTFLGTQNWTFDLRCCLLCWRCIDDGCQR